MSGIMGVGEGSRQGNREKTKPSVPSSRCWRHRLTWERLRELFENLIDEVSRSTAAFCCCDENNVELFPNTENHNEYQLTEVPQSKIMRCVMIGLFPTQLHFFVGRAENELRR